MRQTRLSEFEIPKELLLKIQNRQIYIQTKYDLSVFGYTKPSNLTDGSWRWFHKEYLREYGAAYYKANRKKKLEESAHYYQEHRELVLKHVSENYFRNKEEKIKCCVEYNKTYKKTHKEAFKKWQKKYYLSEKGKLAYQKMMARRREKGFEKNRLL